MRSPSVHPGAGGGPGPGGPLAGMRVVELAHERVAFAGHLFAELGAEVVVVEPPGGSDCRRLGPFAGDEENLEQSLWWWHFQAAKRSVVVDLSSADGRDRLVRLVATADCMLEAEDADRLEAAGLGPEDMRRRFPSLVWVSITPFGRRRPRSREPSTDLTVLSEGGPVWSCGYDDHALPPVRGGADQAMQTAGIHAAVGALTALVQREVSGRGQLVDVSMHAAANVTTEAATYHWLVAQETVERQTCRHASQRRTAPTMAYDVDGRPVNTGMPPRSAEEFATVLHWLDELGLTGEFPDVVLLGLGVECGGVHLADVREPGLPQEIFGAGREALRLILSRMPAQRFFVEGQRRGLAVGVINSPDEVIEDPHFQARGFARSLFQPAAGRPVVDSGPPWRFTGSPVRLSRGAPLLGEHDDVVLGTLGAAAQGGERDGA